MRGIDVSLGSGEAKTKSRSTMLHFLVLKEYWGKEIKRMG